MRIIFRSYLRALLIALSISQIYKNIAMKQSLLAITTITLLLGGMVTVALIQNIDAGSIITTRSNIKSGIAVEANGDKSQAVFQEINIQ